MRWRAIAASVSGLMLVSGLAWSFLAPTGGAQFLAQDDGPRLPDGRVDYLAKLNQSTSDGVTPENNAVVVLLGVLGKRVLNGIDQQAFLKELGLDQFPSGRPLFVSWSEHAGRLGFSPGSPAYDQWMESIKYSATELWTAEQYPELASWIEDNEQAIEEVVKASLRPRFFFPLFPSENSPDAESNVRMLEMSLDLIQETREIARVLVIRAMQHLAADDTEAAIRDIQTIRRLASLQTQSLTTIEILVSVNLSGMAFSAETELLGSGKLSTEQCQAYRRFLMENPLTLQLPKRFESAERSLYLDAVQTLERGRAANLNFSLDLSGLDWAAIEERASNYHTFSKAWTQPSDRVRLAKIQEMESELTGALERNRSVGGIAAAFLSRKARSQMVGNMLLALNAPAYTALADMEIREKTSRDLLEIAFAIESYRLATGKFPEALEPLTPEYLKEIPLDRHTEKSLVYRPTVTGYRLYSVGKNQIDDQGQTKSESENADDWGMAIDLEDGD